MLDVRFERISYGVNEKKTLTPTIKMVEMALKNVGFSDGVWLLKSPHRTRKKGAERFRAIRFDGSGIRIRCKPGGNDTCYEWTLFPPAGTDQDLLFSDLCSLHPKDLRLVGSSSSLRSEVAVLGGLVRHMKDAEPQLQAPARKEEDEALESSYERWEPEEDEGLGQKDLSEAFARSEPKISSLDISDESGRLRSEDVLDRALVALAIALGEENSVPRAVSSEVMVRKLNVAGLLEKNDLYDSTRGAMKAIMMSLRRKGYIDRILGERNSNGGHWVKGYVITKKGEKRLEFLSQMLAPTILSELKGESVTPPEEPPAAPEEPVAAVVADDRIGAIKGMIGEYESVKKQIGELAEMMDELRRECEDGDLLVSGLRKALEEKEKERKALDREIARFEEKVKELEAKSAKGGSDMDALRAEMESLESKKSGLESKIFSAG